ncbi:MAG: hypothetical protein AB7S81_03175 [Bdellovibrionales bacterium]
MRWRLEIIAKATAMGVRNASANPLPVLGGFLLYLMIMVLYAGIINMVPEEDIAPLYLSHAQMIWYIGATEMIVFSGVGWAWKEIQNAFLSGDAILSLVRPASAALIRCSFWMGESLVRMAIFFPLYLLLMWYLSDAFVFDIWHALGLLLSMPLAVVMMNCASYAIGGLCLWVTQADPVFWVWQKLIFLLGAMLWPLLFYPRVIQEILPWLPFYGILTHSGNWALDMSLRDYVYGFLNQFLWTALFLWFLKFFDLKVIARIQKGDR